MHWRQLQARTPSVFTLKFASLVNDLHTKIEKFVA